MHIRDALIRVLLVIVFSLPTGVSSLAAEIVFAENETTVVKIDETQLLDRARSFGAKEGWGTKIRDCKRIIFFRERIKNACIAVELDMEAIDYPTGKEKSVQFVSVLWFDVKGNVCNDAEPVGLDDSVIPGNPISQH